MNEDREQRTDAGRMSGDGRGRGRRGTQGGRRATAADAYRPVRGATPRGTVAYRYYPAAAAAGRPATRAALLVGGAGGGWDSPVDGGLYPRLCRQLRAAGVASLRVRYRRPADLDESVADAAAGLRFLRDEGAAAVAVVGHSFGGAVAIRAAAASPAVRACVALATQGYGAEPAARLGPRCALLLCHGTADEILPAAGSRAVHSAAGQPKQLLLRAGTGHGLDEWATT